MDYIFTQNELKWLDDIMPEDKSKRKEDETKIAEDDEGDAEVRRRKEMFYLTTHSTCFVYGYMEGINKSFS